MKKWIGILQLMVLLGGPFLAGEEHTSQTAKRRAFPEEDSETVFRTNLGDADVDLFLQGSWESSVSGSLGLSLVPGEGYNRSYTFPGFTEGLVFRQTPDLTLSLWLMERYFFETNYGENYRMNTYLLGYQGKEGEFVQSIKAGNKEIEMSPFPYMDFPGSSWRSPGLAAMFQTSRSRHEFFLRYDPSAAQKKTFVGKNEVNDLRRDPQYYVRGKFFVLPDPAVDFVTVFIEDAEGSVRAGDGRRYKKATDAEAAFSLSDGTVTLAKPSAGRVLVFYEKGGQAVGASSLGSKALPAYVQKTASSPVELDPLGTPEDFSWSRGPYMGKPIARFRVSAAGNDCLLVYDPGLFTPFENQGVYSLEGISVTDNDSSSIKIVRKGSSGVYATKNALSLVLDGGNAYVRVVSDPGKPRSMLNRYPFADDLPRLYGPDLLSDGGGADFEILARTYTPVQAFVLTNDVIPGSVKVYRNGKREELFTVDYASGTVAFSFEVASSDTIEIYYRTFSGEGEGGDILFGTGNTIQLRDDLVLKLAGSVRWNVLKGSYSTEPDDHPGSIGGSAEISYKGGKVSAVADGAVVYSNPDTSGLLRLLGMEKAEISIAMSKDNMFPSSVPASDFFSGGLTSSNRGKLYFKNYETEDLVGNVSVNDYTWTPPSSQQFPYKDGSKPGPYVAGANAEGFARVMVMDYDLSSSQKWVGAQINLSTGKSGSVNFSKISAIRFAYKVVAFSGAELSLNLQTGAVSEDLDGDGVLDEESGASSRGYEFNDGVLTLYVGGGQKGLGNGKRDSEDANWNGVLEQENSELVFPGPADSSSFGYAIAETGSWKTGLLRVPAADANRLSKVRAVRIVLKKEGPGAASGKVLVGPIVFEGTDLASQVSGSGSLRMREILETLVDEPAPVSLAKAHPGTIDTFHSGGGDQKVLETIWKNFAVSDTWELKSFTTEVPAENYRRINLFIRTAKLGSGSASITLSYTDSEGKGITATFPVTATNTWERLSIDIGKRRVTLGENVMPAPTVDSSYGKLTRFSLVQTGTDGGTMYFDELYLSDPAASVGFAGSLVATYSSPGTNIEVGTVPLLRNFAVTQKISGQSKTFQSQIEKTSDETTTAGYLYSSTSASGHVLSFLGLEGDFSLNVLDARVEYEGGHLVRFPAEGGPVVVREQFKRTFRAVAPSMSRSNGLDVRPVDWIAWNSNADTSFADSALVQRWGTALDITHPAMPFFKLAASLRNEAEGYVLEDASYAGAWTSSYSLLSPWTGGSATVRQGQLSVSAGRISEPVGFTLNPEVSYVNDGETSRRQKNREKVFLELPLVFRAGETDPGWKLAFTYEREGITKVGAAESGDFRSDVGRLGKGLSNQRYFYDSIPFVEIFAPSSWTGFKADSEGAYAADYTPRAGLLYSRAYGSNIVDLLVPSRAELAFAKAYARSDDAVSAKNTSDLKFTNFAVNLFGTDGAYPFFSWYASDEFQIQNSASVEKIEGETDVDWSYTNKVSLSVFGRREDRFVLEHTIALKNEDRYVYQGTGSVKYVWKQEMTRTVTSEFMLKMLEDRRYYVHTEKAELTYDNKDGVRTYVVLGHETALTLKKSGFIKAGADLGLGIERDGSGLWPGYKILLGLQAGISAHFVF